MSWFVCCSSTKQKPQVVKPPRDASPPRATSPGASLQNSQLNPGTQNQVGPTSNSPTNITVPEITLGLSNGTPTKKAPGVIFGIGSYRDINDSKSNSNGRNSHFKIKKKCGLKSYDDREMKVGLFLLKDKIDSNTEMLSEYSRNTEDFEADVSEKVGCKLDSLHEKISPEVIQQYCQKHRKSLEQILISREPPLEYRWMIWMIFACGVSSTHSLGMNGVAFGVSDHSDKKKLSLMEYQYMTQVLDETSDKLIEGDVERTFPNHPFYSTKVLGLYIGKDKLVRLCRASGVYYKRIAYTQGMSLLLALLLQHSGGDEHESFLFFNHLMKAPNIQFFMVLEENFSMSFFLSYLFHKKLAIILPDLNTFIEENGYPDDCWLTKWWISMFSGYADDYLVTRIIDVLLVTDIFFLVDIALAICSVLYPKVINKEPDEFNLCMKNLFVHSEITTRHPNKLISMAMRYRSSRQEIQDYIKEYCRECTNSAVVSTILKFGEAFRIYVQGREEEGDIYAGENSEDKLYYDEAVSMSVYSVKDKVTRFTLGGVDINTDGDKVENKQKMVSEKYIERK